MSLPLSIKALAVAGAASSVILIQSGSAVSNDLSAPPAAPSDTLSQVDAAARPVLAPTAADQSVTVPSEITPTVATGSAAPVSSPSVTVESTPILAPTGSVQPDADGCFISGSVKDGESGRPIPDAAVVVSHSSIWTKTGFDGSFCLDGYAGFFTLYAAKDFYAGSSQVDVDVRQQPVKNVEITLTPLKTVGREYVEPAVTYRPGASGLKVTIKDTQTGKGIPGIAVVTAYAGVPGGENRVTGADGSFFDATIGEWPNTYKLFLANRDGGPIVQTYVEKVAKVEYQIQIVRDYVTEWEISL